MNEIKHELNIYNPAEFFASLGVLTVSGLQHPNADIHSHFAISGHRGESNATLVVRSEALLSLETVVRELANATLVEDKTANVWKNPNENSRLISPVTLKTDTWSITLDWWLDELRWKSSELKFWSGNSRPLEMLRSFIKLGTGFVKAGGTVFGFDTRTSRDALTVGYSKKDTGEKAGLYPLTELLCAIGLQQYRPHNCTYYGWRQSIPLSITHGAAIQEIPGLQQSKYEFAVQKIGQGVKQAFPAAEDFEAASAS